MERTFQKNEKSNNYYHVMRKFKSWQSKTSISYDNSVMTMGIHNV